MAKGFEMSKDGKDRDFLDGRFHREIIDSLDEELEMELAGYRTCGRSCPLCTCSDDVFSHEQVALPQGENQ